MGVHLDCKIAGSAQVSNAVVDREGIHNPNRIGKAEALRPCFLCDL